MMAASHYHFTMATIIVAVVLLCNVNESLAFSVQPRTVIASRKMTMTKTQLSAWSIPTPADVRAFTSMTSSWYNEYNPTARRTVYNDSPMDSTLFVMGFGDDDWSILGGSPSSSSSSSSSQPAETSSSSSSSPVRGDSSRTRRNPVRRAANLVGRVVGGRRPPVNSSPRREDDYNM